MAAPTSIHSRRYPKFIRNHKVFKDIELKSVFPSIGLQNSRALLRLDDVAMVKRHAFRFLHHIESNIVCYSGCYSDYSKSILQALRKLEFRKVGNRYSLLTTTQIKSPHKTYRIGSDIFPILRAYARNRCIGLADDLRWSEFLALNKPGLTINFSSTGNNGAWDMATMSMRGISSCQRWSSMTHRGHLIGSIVDPCAGILYIASNANTRYGKRMIRRSVIRYIYNVQTGRPGLLIERIYPHDYDYDYDGGPSQGNLTLTLFKRFLRQKTSGRLPIFYGDNDEFSYDDRHFIPKSNTLSLLDFNKELSYRDSGIDYNPVDNLRNPKLSKLVV